MDLVRPEDVGLSSERLARIPQHLELAETMELLAELPLEFSPGTRWNYPVSTDSLRFCSMLANGGRQVTCEGVGFGLGFSVTLDLARAQTVGSVGEYAWGGAASTAFRIDPAEELIVISMTRLMPSGTFNFRGQLKSLIHPALL